MTSHVTQSKMTEPIAFDSLLVILTSVTSLFLSDFEQVCDRLYGIIRACSSDSLLFNFLSPLNAALQSRVTIVTPVKRHSNGVSLEDR